MMLVTGPSGSGKSQLLRSIAALNSVDNGNISLEGNDWKHRHQNYWRRQVRYVTQYKVDVPGTPSDFIRKVTGFKAWCDDPSAISFDEMSKVSLGFLRQWGVQSDCMTKEWKMLSGGEAQRLILALSLASSPKVLLLDETTSALDMESKSSVEQSIISFAKQSGCIILLVSHDTEQMERLRSDV
jgi:ABC-type iron transport system FetAB ATPase subunit